MERGDVTVPVTADPAFEELYRSRLARLEGSTEVHRRFALAETRRRAVAGTVGIVVGAGLFGVIAAPGMADLWWFFFVLWAMVAVVLGAWSWWPKLGQASQQKEDVVSVLVPFYGDLEFVPHPNLDLNRYRRWAVLPAFDSRWARDQIRGSRRRIPFSATEVVLRRKGSHRSGSSSQSTPIFEGLFVEIRLPEKLPAKSVFGSTGMFTGIFEPDSGLEAFGAWSPDFDVYGTDLKEAERLLDGSFLQALARVRDELAAKRLLGGFFRDRLLLLVDREPYDFEASQSLTTDLKGHAEEVRAHLAPILGVLETLPLQPVLGLDETVVEREEAGDEEPVPVVETLRSHGRFTGWGCFFVFVAWAAALAVAAWFARSRFDGAEIPGVAVVAASVIAMVIGALIFRWKPD